MAKGEVISFNIGQCGIQTGSACWCLYGAEHGISCDGLLNTYSKNADHSFTSFYKESQFNKLVPRTLFMDLEPSVIDELRTGANRNIFHIDDMLNSFEDSANNFARGFYTCGRLLIKDVIFSTRRQVESCNALKCFIVHHSYGGGTGSGFMSMLMEYLMSEYGKTTKIDLGLIPNETLSCSCIEPYNAILGIHHPIESTDLGILCENEPLYHICKSKLRQSHPLFPHLNQIVSQLMSGITSCTRFESSLGCSLNDIQTSLVPYPSIHFPLVSYAPIGRQETNMRSVLSTDEITKAAFHPSNQMVSVEANEGKVMACSLLYRGDVSPQNVSNTINNVKRNKDMEWVEWCPTGFKVGITYQPISLSPKNILANSLRSVTLLKNSTVVRTVFNRLGQKFWQLFSRKAFIHWFVAEGMEEKEFKDAFDDLMMLSNDLNLLEKDSDDINLDDLSVLQSSKKDEGKDLSRNKNELGTPSKSEGQSKKRSFNPSDTLSRSDRSKQRST